MLAIWLLTFKSEDQALQSFVHKNVLDNISVDDLVLQANLVRIVEDDMNDDDEALSDQMKNNGNRISSNTGVTQKKSIREYDCKLCLV